MSTFKRKCVSTNKVVSSTKAFDVELWGSRISSQSAPPTAEQHKTKQQVYSVPLGSVETLYNYTFDKGRLKSLVLWSLKKYGEAKTIILLENLKKTGFEYATKAGISLGVEDLKIPPKKAGLLYEAEIITKEAVDQFERSEITGVERYQRLIEAWHRTSEELKQEVIDNFEKTDILNPVYMMAFSGARGNISQVRQLVGMRGLMSDPKGQLIDYPIRSNFREGLTITEYIISSYGARKGIVDTALRTATAGYLTRRLVDVAQHVVISAYDCGTNDGVFLTDIKEGTKTIFSLQTRLLGRVLARNLYKKDLGSQNAEHLDAGLKKKMRSKLASRNQEVSANLAAEIPKHYKKVFVRSPLTCHKKQFICQLCYGWSLAQGNLVSIGEAVGIVAAQSIGEPGTQLTMRTFHTGGAFAGEISDQIRAPFNGIVHYPDKIAGMLCRNPDGKMVFLTKIDGIILVNPSNGSNQQPKQFKIPAYTLLYNQPGESVHHKQVIAQISAIARQAGMQEDASLVLKSQMQGQFMIQKLTLQSLLIGPKFAAKSNTKAPSGVQDTGVRERPQFEKTEIPGYSPINQDKLFAAWNWGYAWILSCQKYHMPVFSSSYGIAGRGASLIPFSGDFVDNNSSLVQVDWYLPQHGGFYTSFSAPPKVQTTDKNWTDQLRGVDKLSTDQNILEKAALLKPINYAAQAWPEKQLKSSNSFGKAEIKIQKTLLALDIRNVVYKKFGYFVDTNKGLTLEGKTYSTVLFLPTNLKGGTAANSSSLRNNSLFNFTLDSYSRKQDLLRRSFGQNLATKKPKQKLKRGQKTGNPKVFGVQAFINMPQNLQKNGAGFKALGKSGPCYPLLRVTNLSQTLLSNLTTEVPSLEKYRKTKITFVTNGPTTKSPSLRVTSMTWPLDKVTSPGLSNDVLNKAMSGTVYGRAFTKSSKTQNLDPYTQYRRLLNYKKTGTDIAHQIKKYYKKNYARLKFSKLLEPVRDFYKEFRATSLLPTLKVPPKSHLAANKNLKVWYSKKNLQDCLLHRAAISIKNNINKAMNNQKIAAAIKALPNQSYLSSLKGNNTSLFENSKNKYAALTGKNKAGLISKVSVIQNKYAPLRAKRQQAYSRAVQLIENQRISRQINLPISNPGGCQGPESGLAKQQCSPLFTSASNLSKRKFGFAKKASLISGLLTSLFKQSMSNLNRSEAPRQSLCNRNPRRAALSRVFNYLVSGLTQYTLDTMFWYSIKKAESWVKKPSRGSFCPPGVGQKLLPAGLFFKAGFENDSRLEVSNLGRQQQILVWKKPTSNKWVYKTFKSIAQATLNHNAVKQVSKVVSSKDCLILAGSKNSLPLPEKDSYINQFLNYNFGQDKVLSTGINASRGDVVWYINNKPRFLPKEFLTVGVAINDAMGPVGSKSSPSGNCSAVSKVVGSLVKTKSWPKSKNALNRAEIFELTKPIYLHISKSSSPLQGQNPEPPPGATRHNNDPGLISKELTKSSLQGYQSRFNRATIIRSSLSDGQGDVKKTNLAQRPTTKYLGHVQPTLKRYSLDTHINNSSNWSSSLIPICRFTNRVACPLVAKPVLRAVVNKPSFCLAGELVIKAAVSNTIFSKPHELTKSGSTKCLKAVFNYYATPLVFYKKVDLSKTLAPKEPRRNWNKRPSIATSRMIRTFLNKQKRTLNPLAKTPNANLFVYSLGASSKKPSWRRGAQSGRGQSQPVGKPNLFTTRPKPSLRPRQNHNALFGKAKNLTSLLLTYHAPNISFSTYKIEDLVQQKLNINAEQPTAKLGQAFKLPKTIQKLNTKLRKAGFEELLGSKAAVSVAKTKSWPKTKRFYMRQAYEVSKYTALGAVTFNEMYINITPPTSYRGLLRSNVLSKATMLEASPLFLKRGTALRDKQSPTGFNLENYLKKAALGPKGQVQKYQKLLQNNTIGTHITLEVKNRFRNSASAAFICPRGQNIWHSLFNQAGLELACLFKYKNFMPNLFTSPSQTPRNGPHFWSNKASNKKHTTSGSLGFKLSYWPLTGVESQSPLWGSADLFGMSKTKYNVAPPGLLGGCYTDRPQFSNISHSLMALASTSFLSTQTGEVVYGFGYSRSPKKALFGKDNPLAYLTKQKIHNNQTRCLILTSKDLKGYNIELFKSENSGGLQDSQLSHLSYEYNSKKIAAKTDFIKVAQVANRGGAAIQSQWVSSVKRSKNVIRLGLSSELKNKDLTPKYPLETALALLPICGQMTLKGQVMSPVDLKSKLSPQIKKVYTSPGQIIGVHWSIRTPNQMNLTIRKGQPIFISARTTFHSFHGDFVKNNESVVTLIYQKIKTGDIIQGIPKVEQFFEARTTKRGLLFRENLPNLLKGLFLKYYYQNLNSLKLTSTGPLSFLKKQISGLAENQNKSSSLDFKYLAVDWAVQQSFYKIRQIAVDGVLRVYRSQGVSISDKHLEVIVKQMTTKVRVIDRGHSALFPGELVDYEFVQKLNGNNKAYKDQRPYLIKKVLYEPMVLGITKASLHVDSFLSAASFQQTARILRESALVKKRDFLKGVKENVMVGNLIPTGTGYIVS